MTESKNQRTHLVEYQKRGLEVRGIPPAEELVSLLHSLISWETTDQPTMSISEAEVALEKMSSACEPIDEKELILAMEGALSMWPTPGNFEALSLMYRKALSIYPHDIVNSAIEEVSVNRIYPTMPMPGEFRAAADRLFADRYRAKARAQLMLAKLKMANSHKASPIAPMAVPQPMPRRITGGDAPDTDVVHLGNTASRMAMWRKHAEASEEF